MILVFHFTLLAASVLSLTIFRLNVRHFFKSVAFSGMVFGWTMCEVFRLFKSILAAI